LPFSQHRENCGLLLFNFANHSLIHIFALQNPHIVSICPQSHHLGADASSSPNNCNASLPREGCSHCLARHSLCRQFRCSCADFDVAWWNSTRTLICGTWFSKESVCSSFRWAFRCYRRTVKATKALPCCAMSARIHSCMSSSILGGGGGGFSSTFVCWCHVCGHCWSLATSTEKLCRQRYWCQNVSQNQSLGWLLQPHFGQVWGWSPTLPKLGIWSPLGLPNV
jgi:hypothetical protein